MRERLGITFNYSDIAGLVYKYSPSQVEVPNNNSPKLEAFTAVKEYLLQNSYVVGNQVYRIYPAILLRTIDEFLQKQKQSNKGFLLRNQSFFQPRYSTLAAKKAKERSFWDTESRMSDRRKIDFQYDSKN